MFPVSPYLYATLSVIAVLVVGFTLLAAKKGWFRWSTYSYTQLTSSAVSPMLFFLFRLFVFCYGIIVLGVSYYLSDEDSSAEWGNTTKGEFFSYYTIWNYILLTIFFMFASIMSFTRLTFGKHKHEEEFMYSRSKLWFLGIVVWVLFEIAITLSVLVDTVLWGILYPYCVHQKGTSFCHGILLNFESINCHILNFVFIFIEFSFNHIVIVPAHVVFILYWAFSYMVFAWIYYGQTGIWDYPFMKTQDTMSVVNYSGLLGLHIFYFFSIYLFDLLKIYITKRNPPRHFDDDDSRPIVIF